MSACPLVDCHTHTSFSDGHASFEDNVRAAAAAGCRVMVSADHLTLPASMDANCEVQVTESDLPAHRLAFEDARKLAAQIAPELELIYGFECDWYEGCEPLVERWSQDAVVRLGSVHWIGNPGDIMAGAAGTAGTENVARPDTPDSLCGWIDDDTNLHVWENLGVHGVWERYVDDWCRACESSLNFDAMDHPDRWDGKKVHMKLIMCHSKKFPGIHCPGRFVMTCCENDIQFVGIVAKGDSLKAYKNRDWVDITATVKKEHLDAYEGEGPVLYVERITTTSKPAQEVVSF